MNFNSFHALHRINVVSERSSRSPHTGLMMMAIPHHLSAIINAAKMLPFNEQTAS